VRRNVSPGSFASPIQIVEVEFPAGAQVAYDSGARDVRVHQQVWVLEGAIEVTVGEDRQELQAGDCFAFTLDRPTAFRNRTSRAARYAVILVSQAEVIR
jgi:quercetin dioxygenase-like cupin family protein